jgi:hypothetical protein
VTERNETLNFVERDSLRRIFVVQVKRAISERNDKTDKRQRQTIVYLNMMMIWPCGIHKYIDRKKPVGQPPSIFFSLSSFLNWQLRISNDWYKQRRYDAKFYIYSSNTYKRRYKYDDKWFWQVWSTWYDDIDLLDKNKYLENIKKDIKEVKIEISFLRTWMK